jgi:hypothetical protein
LLELPELLVQLQNPIFHGDFTCILHLKFSLKATSSCLHSQL